MRILIRYWLPLVVWAAAILAASSDALSSAHTGSILETLVVAVYGRNPLTSWQFEVVHFTIRKLAHLFEYGIFGALAFRAVRAGRRGWKMEWAAIAVAIAIALAATDEWHQSYVPSRTPSPADVALDSFAATLVQFAIVLRVRGA